MYSDLRKLQRDYPEVDAQRMIDRCVDLGPWCNEVCNTGGRWSMERLVMYLVRLDQTDEAFYNSYFILLPVPDANQQGRQSTTQQMGYSAPKSGPADICGHWCLRKFIIFLLYSVFLIQTIISSFLNLLPDQTSHFRTRKCLSTSMLKSVTQW